MNGFTYGVVWMCPRGHMQVITETPENPGCECGEDPANISGSLVARETFPLVLGPLEDGMPRFDPVRSATLLKTATLLRERSVECAAGDEVGADILLRQAEEFERLAELLAQPTKEGPPCPYCGLRDAHNPCELCQYGW